MVTHTSREFISMFNVCLKEDIRNTKYYYISKISVFKHLFRHLMTPVFMKLLKLSFIMKTLNGKMIIDLGNPRISSINLINILSIHNLHFIFSPWVFDEVESISTFKIVIESKLQI